MATKTPKRRARRKDDRQVNAAKKKQIPRTRVSKPTKSFVELIALRDQFKEEKKLLEKSEKLWRENLANIHAKFPDAVVTQAMTIVWWDKLGMRRVSERFDDLDRYLRKSRRTSKDKIAVAKCLVAVGYTVEAAKKRVVNLDQ